LRWQVTRRAQIVRQRTRLKSQVQPISHRKLVECCPFSICSGSRAAAGSLISAPCEEDHAVEALLRQLDFHGQELWIIDAALGRIALSGARSSS
jgi:transposase